MNANDLTMEVREEFLRKNANLLALTRNGANDVLKRISASMALDEGARDEVLFLSDVEYLEQKGHTGRIARDSFKSEMYRQICRHFLRVQRNCRIEFVSKLTPEAPAELEALEVAAGERQPAPPPPPPPAKPQTEILEEQVRSDWKELSTDKLKKKLNNPEYNATFDRLMAANQLESVATSYTDGSAEFRQ
jgi:hypothetical protein